MDLQEAKIIGVRQLQDANMLLCDAYFTLEEHTNPGFKLELTKIQEGIREMIGAIKNLQ